MTDRFQIVHEQKLVAICAGPAPLVNDLLTVRNSRYFVSYRDWNFVKDEDSARVVAYKGRLTINVVKVDDDR